MDLNLLIQECIYEVLQEGTIECSWCRQPMGTWEGDGVSHGICPNCKIKMRDQLNAMKAKNGGTVIPSVQPQPPTST